MTNRFWMWIKSTTFKSESRDKREFALGSNIGNYLYRVRAADRVFLLDLPFFYFQEKFKVLHGHLEENSFLSLISHFLNYQERKFISPPSKTLLKKPLFSYQVQFFMYFLITFWLLSHSPPHWQVLSMFHRLYYVRIS